MARHLERALLVDQRSENQEVLAHLPALHSLFWEEEVQNGDIQPHASVLLTLNAAYDAYQETVSRARRPALKVGEFRDVLLSLERRAIVRLGPEDDQAQDRELTIRALVSEVAGDDFLTSLEQLLQRPDVVEDDADEEPAAPEADRAEVEVSA